MQKRQCKFLSLHQNYFFSTQSFIKYILLLLLLGISEIAAVNAQNAIVYSRCERTTGSIDLTADITVNGQVQTVTRTFTGLDIYDRLPDVRSFLSGFAAPCDLVYRDETGEETIIYDCSSTSTDESSCAALDAAVSFDGTKIAFSVFRGELYNIRFFPRSQVFSPDAKSGENAGGFDLPNKRLSTTGAHLHFYDIQTGQIDAIPFESGIYDSGPAFISENRIAFTSTRDGNRTTKVWGTNNPGMGTRIWAMDIDGKNPDLASHHSLSQEQHPFMLKNGRLAYSSWQIFGGLPFRHGNGAAGGFTTLTNLFHIYSQNPDGSHNFPIYGQHSGGHLPSYFGKDHKAAHFLTQTSDERIWTADYYRGSNKGLGIVIGIMQEPDGQEGIGPQEAETIGDIYVPRDVIRAALWDSNADRFARPMDPPEVNHPNYADPLPFKGKLGHPAALPNNELMMVWGKGACSAVASGHIFPHLEMETPPMVSGGGGAALNVMTSINLDTPGCDTGIYKATQIPSEHPSDLEMIVDSREWHEIMARAVVPYADIHGVDKPKTIEKADKRTNHAMLEEGTPFGLLGAASITDRETHPKHGIKFAGERQFNLQGTDTVDYTDDELCGIRMLGVMPNRGNLGTDAAKEIANVAGERLAILGEVPVLNKDSNGNRIIDPSGHPDTSFLLRMPANTPYLMQGIDCEGRTLNTDQTWQSLRPGEQKTCGGCHVHSRPPRIEFEQSFASTTAYSVPRLGEGAVPLMTGKADQEIQITTISGYGVQIDFNRDIKPIFDQHCISCHGGDNPAAGLPLDHTGGDNKANDSTWRQLVADKRQQLIPDKFKVNNGHTLRRPQLTKYIRAFNSRGSLLYWKAANQRTDNRTDAQYADDIDFGEDHPTTITANELRLLSRWIDLGSPGGPQELRDTQKPTLHLAASQNDGGVSQLRVGTVDLGSGIDPNSLVVCIFGQDHNCTNLAGPAEMHGVTIVDLGGGLSDPNTEIYARVRDKAGNMTELYRSVDWFLNNGSGESDSGTDTDADNESPKITITSPAGGEVSGIINVEMDYSDNVGVVAVDLYLNNQLFETKTQVPFTFTIDTTSIAEGDYILTAHAFDEAGNQGASNNVKVTVSNNPVDTESPVVFLASPQQDAEVSGVIQVSFEVDDNVGVTRIELYANEVLVGTSEQSPFGINWDTTQSVDGGAYLQAYAFDEAGNQGISPLREINVKNGAELITDEEPPSIFITSPRQREIVSGTTEVRFETDDNVGVTRVELYVNEVLVGTNVHSPFSIDWDTTQSENGIVSLQVYAFDEAGNKGISSSMRIWVRNTIGPVRGPGR